MNNLDVRRIDSTADIRELEEIARIHEAEISDGFLPTLGLRFLQLLYLGIATSPSTVLFAATLDGRIVGFVAGAFSTSTFYREFARRFYGRILSLLMVQAVRRPRIIVKCFETLTYPSRARSISEERPEILNFCVLRDFQGCGIGRALFEALTSEFAKTGVRTVRIVTGADQKSARTFYERAGAKHTADTEIHRNVKSIVFEYDITTSH